MIRFFSKLMPKGKKRSDGHSTSSEGLEMMAIAGTSGVQQDSNLNLIYEDLQRYGDEQYYAQIDGTRWLNLNMVYSILSVEYASEIKVPICSLKRACNILWAESVPDLPEVLAYVDLQTEDILSYLEYWVWISEEHKSGLLSDYQHCDVKIEKDVRRRDSKKLRARWIMPLLVVAEEIRYFLPLVDSFRQGEGGCNFFFPQSSYEGCMLPYDEDLYDFVEHRYLRDYKFVVIKYRVFESVISNRLIKLCFDVLMHKIDFSTEKQTSGLHRKVDATGFRRRFLKMVEYFLKIPIHVKYGRNKYTIEKDRGIPGGSCFSHLISTMCNFLITWTVSILVFKREPLMYRFHGKKGLLVYERRAVLNMKKFSEEVETYFGVVVDPIRTCISSNVDDFHTLGYCCNIDDED